MAQTAGKRKGAINDVKIDTYILFRRCNRRHICRYFYLLPYLRRTSWQKIYWKIKSEELLMEWRKNQGFIIVNQNNNRRCWICTRCAREQSQQLCYMEMQRQGRLLLGTLFYKSACGTKGFLQACAWRNQGYRGYEQAAENKWTVRWNECAIRIMTGVTVAVVLI